MASPAAAKTPAEIERRLAADPIDVEALSRWLDALGHDERVAATRSLGRSAQRRLFAAVDGFRPVRLVELVPPGAEDLETVRHFGRNTLPAFRRFEKRFCRPPGVDPSSPARLYGFNHQTLAAITGPGYFVAREDPGRGEVLVDYNDVPSDRPDGWPVIRRNEVGLSRFVYGFMVDRLRRVSEHVTVGSAARRGRELGSWFVLCREE